MTSAVSFRIDTAKDSDVIDRLKTYLKGITHSVCFEISDDVKKPHVHGIAWMNVPNEQKARMAFRRDVKPPKGAMCSFGLVKKRKAHKFLADAIKDYEAYVHKGTGPGEWECISSYGLVYSPEEQSRLNREHHKAKPCKPVKIVDKIAERLRGVQEPTRREVVRATLNHFVEQSSCVDVYMVRKIVNGVMLRLGGKNAFDELMDVIMERF